jgi:hypothetical protein
MEASMRITLSLLLVVAVGLPAAGCGDPVKYQTRGRVLKNGEPFHPPGDDTLRVTLMPISEDGSRARDWYVASYYLEDGTFRVRGNDGKGMPPGKYRVLVEQIRNRNDVLKGAFFAEKSPFVREIRNGSDEITIDLGKPYSRYVKFRGARVLSNRKAPASRGSSIRG